MTLGVKNKHQLKSMLSIKTYSELVQVYEIEDWNEKETF